jgi:hypothetical protein
MGLLEGILWKTKGVYRIVKSETVMLNDSSLIKGVLTDKKDKKPISHGSISLMNTKIGIISDINGIFTLTIPKGKYKICASNTGHTNLCTKEIQLKPNEALTINFELGTTVIE